MKKEDKVTNTGNIKNVSSIKPEDFSDKKIDYINKNQYGKTKLAKDRIRELLRYGEKLRALGLMEVAQREEWDEKRIKAEIEKYSINT